MIQGNKPSGYSVLSHPDGSKKEMEKRQCAHCQFSWIYRPGSGVRRGYCSRCNGLLCGKPQCMEYCIPYINKIEGMEKGQSFKNLLKSAHQKYGSNILGKTKQVE